MAKQKGSREEERRGGAEQEEKESTTAGEKEEERDHGVPRGSPVLQGPSFVRNEAPSRNARRFPLPRDRG